MLTFPTQSEKIDKIANALFIAKKKIAEVPKTANNPYFNSKYADFGAVWGACKEPLETEGIMVIQSPVPSARERCLSLETKMVHVESGQWIASLAEIPLSKSDPQAYGSALTYGRRYTLCTVLGIVTTDDDGNGASGEETPPQKPPQQAPAQPRPQQTQQPQLSGPPQGQAVQSPKPPQGKPFQTQDQGLPTLPPHLGGGSVTFIKFPGKDGKTYIKAMGKVSDHYGVLKKLGFQKADNKIWWRRAA